MPRQNLEIPVEIASRLDDTGVAPADRTPVRIVEECEYVSRMLREGGSNYDDEPAAVRRTLLRQCQRYIEAARPVIAGLVPVRISRTIVDEYCGRAVFGGDGEYPLVPSSAGRHLLPRATAQAMLDDALFNGDAAGGPEEMPAGTRRAYRALAGQLRALLNPSADAAEQLNPAKIQ